MLGNQFRGKALTLLRVLLRMLRGISPDSSALLPRSVQPDEALSTFVKDRNRFDKKTLEIRYQQLMPRPNPKTGRLETSVCRSASLTDEQLWGICGTHFDAPPQRQAIGRGVGPASAVLNVGLSIDPDGVPYPEHANVIGWHAPIGVPSDELKNHWMDRAQRMAPHFRYVARAG